VVRLCFVFLSATSGNYQTMVDFIFHNTGCVHLGLNTRSWQGMNDTCTT